MVKAKEINYPMIAYIEVAIMDNGEVLHFGKSLGYLNKRQIALLENGAHKQTRGSEPVVALGQATA